MTVRRLKGSKLIVWLPALAVFAVLGGTAFAQYSSSNYQSTEIQFGSGGGLGSSSSYQAQQSLGSLGVGRYNSSSYQAYPGNITPNVPFLEFVVNAAVSPDLGVLSVAAPSTTTATFHVKTYLSDGYVVTTTSPGPKNGAYSMQTLGSPTTSSPGTEQFGINLAANSSCGNGLPASLGSGPVQVPDNTFSFGTVTSNYNQACKFTYNQNDTIAQSTQSSGETDYTISFMYNISNQTPSGTYYLNDTLVATSTF